MEKNNIIIIMMILFTAPNIITSQAEVTFKADKPIPVRIDVGELEQIRETAGNIVEDAVSKIAKAIPIAAGEPIPVKLDLSDLGKQVGAIAGDTTTNVVSEIIKAIPRGLQEATKGGEFKDLTQAGIENITKDITRAIADALSDPELKGELERGGSEWASMVGAGAKGARVGLQKEVYPEVQQITQGAIGTVFNFKNALQIGLPAVAVPIVFISGIYATSLAWRLIDQRLFNPKPAILLAGSKVGRTDRIKRWWAGYKSPSIIFDASVKERLEEIIEKTKNIKTHIKNGENITYDNLLLYGSPGTGKTLFAQILADYTDMDFLPVTAASLLQAGVEGIKYFDELLTIANNSKYGVIIFVDEADGLFVDRDKLDPASDHYKVLNHILAATGSGSNKFMLVAATNHAYVMDPAMGRRFQDRVLMPLPDEGTRKELLVMYINEQLFNAKTRKPQFISAAQAILTQSRIDEIAQQTQNLSHAEIKDMVTIMGKKANATKDGIITKRNVDTAVDEAIEKKKALERDRIELEKKNRAMQMQPQYMQPQIMSAPEGAAAAV